MSKYLHKIRVNFLHENVIEDVNMSILSDALVSLLNDEIRAKLKQVEVSPETYRTVLLEYFELNK